MDEIDRFTLTIKKGYASLLKASKDIFDVGFEKLADKPFTKFFTMMKQVPSLLKLKSYMTVAQMVNSHINTLYCAKPFQSIRFWLAAILLPQLRFTP